MMTARERTLYTLVRSCYQLRAFGVKKSCQFSAPISFRQAHVCAAKNLPTGGQTSQHHTDNSILKAALCTVACLGVSLVSLREAVKASEKEKQKPQPQKIDDVEEKRIIQEADALYSQHQVDKLYDFLRGYEHVESAQIGWRQARAACDKAKHCDPKSEERKALMHEGFKYAQKSIALDDKCGPCHRWYAVMLNYVGDYEGTKQKLKYSYIVETHFKEAVRLNPKDATAMYCLGQWCYFFADMSWYTHKIASLIFGTPPTSTFQEALEYFSNAEKTDPNFYNMNHVMLAKTYIKLNNIAKAKEHLVKARDLPVKSPDDRDAHKESIELLGKLQN